MNFIETSEDSHSRSHAAENLSDDEEDWTVQNPTYKCLLPTNNTSTKSEENLSSDLGKAKAKGPKLELSTSTLPCMKIPPQQPRGGLSLPLLKINNDIVVHSNYQDESHHQSHQNSKPKRMSKQNPLVKLDPILGDSICPSMPKIELAKTATISADKTLLDQKAPLNPYLGATGNLLNLPSYEQFLPNSSLDIMSKANSHCSEEGARTGKLNLESAIGKSSTSCKYNIDTNIDVEELLRKHSGFTRYYQQKLAAFTPKETDRLTIALNTVIGMPHAQRLSLSDFKAYE